MTLAIAMLAAAPETGRTAPDGAGQDAIDRICAHLRLAVPEPVPLVLIDAGSGDGTAHRLAGFAASSHAQHVALSRTGHSRDIVCDIVRRMTGCRHVLLLQPQDRLVAGTLPRLAAWLERHDPDLTLLAGGWWLTDLPGRPRAGAGAGLAFPDAPRQTALQDGAPAEALLALTPDPRRLLQGQGSAPGHDPFADPAAAWAAWEAALAGAGAAMLFADPVLLRPFPQVSAAPAVAVLHDRLLAAPRGAQAGLLARLAPWVGDAFALSSARAAWPVAEAIHRLWAGMPRRLRRLAIALPGPAGSVFKATSEGQLLAVLALLATARHEALTASLVADHRQLRADLDLALPGPDYLADLYARVRAL